MQSGKKYISYSLVTTSLAVLGFTIVVACTDQQAKAKPNMVFKTAPRPGVLAKIGTEEITEDALIGDDKVDFFDLKKREYELKMDRLNKLMVEKLIGNEAKKANMSLDDYLKKNVTKGDIKVSDAEYKKFVAEKHIPETQINPQIKDRINEYLKSQKKQDMVTAYVAKLTKSAPIEVYFQKPKMSVDVQAGDSPFIGSAKAAVTIVEFSDFQCPFCSRAADTVHELKKKYGDRIKLAYKNFPLPMHKDARPAAEAALCVNEQGMDKFWKFHDLAFKNQDKLDTNSLQKFAKDSGVDSKKFSDCITAKKFASAVQKDLEYGEKIGVKSTPTFFVNGQIVNGALPVDSFSEIIDDELSETKKN